MPARHVRAAQARRTQTPNATMTTLASPTQGPTGALSLWRVEMRAGQQGPQHAFDTEQVWHLLRGEATVTEGTRQLLLAAGDTVVLPADAERQVSARTDAQFIVCGHAGAIVRVPGEAATRGTPPWIA